MTDPAVLSASASPPPGRTGRTRRAAAWLVSPVMLGIGTAGFLAGYYVMWNVELQLIWLTALCLPPLIASAVQCRAGGMTREWTLRLAAIFLVWNLTVGIVRNPVAFERYYTFEFLAGSLLLPVFLGSVWVVCRNGGATVLIRTLQWAGIVAAVAGICWWQFVQTMDEPGARLRNPLVHGGQHPVATGLSLAFSVVAAAIGYAAATTARCRIGILAGVIPLMLAALLTISRGALLALFCAPAGLGAGWLLGVMAAMARGRRWRDAVRLPARQWSRFWPPVLTALLVFTGFQLAIPQLNVIQDAENSPSLGVLTSTPVHEYVSRGDSGRMEIYQEGLALLNSPGKYLTGAGLWAPEARITEVTRGTIDHMHSLFVATLLHGGVVGLGLFVVMLGSAFYKAWRLAQDGEFRWLALLSCGTGGLIFDGQSACSLVTHPRFENLLFWFPVIAVTAVWRNRTESQSQTGRQPSSSESR